jgi:hypothetical protein
VGLENKSQPDRDAMHFARVFVMWDLSLRACVRACVGAAPNRRWGESNLIWMLNCVESRRAALTSRW